MSLVSFAPFDSLPARRTTRFAPRVVLASLLAVCLFSATATAEEPAPPKRPAQAGNNAGACVEVKGSVRNEGYGWAHLVTLRNGCDKSVVCEVWTNVDPTPRYTLRARPGESDEVVTRHGSPAREVSADFSCKYE